MDKSGPLTVDWYVVFTESTYKSWFMNRLMPGFQHVYAMKKSAEGNFWYIVNPRVQYLQVSQELVASFPHPRVYAGPEAVILPVRAEIKAEGVRGHLCVFNCVEVVKGLLGIKKPFILTPWQLYKYLRGHHGRDICKKG